MGEGRRLSICLVSAGHSCAVLPLYQQLIKAVHLNEINYCKLSIMYIHHLFFANDKFKKSLQVVNLFSVRYRNINDLISLRSHVITLYKVYSLVEKQEGKHVGTNVMTYLNC